MGFYSIVHINITFKQNTPACVTDFFTEGIKNEALPNFLYDMGFDFNNKINLITPEMLLIQYGAKTFIDDQASNHFYLQFTQEFDLDSYILSVYPFITFVASYAEDSAMAGYIKDEMNEYDAFAIKDGIVHWQQKQKINIDANKKLDYFELITLGTKIKFSHGSEVQINEWMNLFDKNVPYPSGSSLFFYPDQKDATKIEIKNYDPTVQQVVEKCLNYKSIV